MLPIRVDGPPRMRYTRLGYSPQAIFRPERAPGNFISCTVRAGMSFRIALRPPIRFAEPGRAWIEVIPPAIASGICGSCGQKECSAQTSAVTGFVASLPSDSAWVHGAAYTPRCECVSMIPGVTHLPVPSTTTASEGGASTVAPTATMRPSRSRIDPPAISWPVAVMIVALRISTGGLACRWYVEGYCGRAPPVSPAAACVGAGAAGPALGRAPAEAQPAAARASARAVERSLMSVILLLDEFEHERGPHRSHAQQPPRRGRAHVHHDGDLHARQLQAVRLESAGGDDDVFDAGHLDREDLHDPFARGEDIQIEAAAFG